MTKILLQQALLDLAEELRILLINDNQNELASQIEMLHIDRCRCGDDFCATFYTAPKPKGAWGAQHETIPLDCEGGYLNLDVVDGKIVSIEVLYRDRFGRNCFS
jgi:hypothetical protein